VIEALPAAQRQAARHHLAHLQFITPRDMGRFAALGAVANFQPLWATADPQMEELTIPFVGAERSAWQYQIGSLVRRERGSRSAVTGPVSSADPLQEIHVAVNRVCPSASGGAGNPNARFPSSPGRRLPSTRRRRLHLRGSLGEPRGRRGRNPAARHAGRSDRARPGSVRHPGPRHRSTSVVMTVAGGTVVYGDR